MTFHDLIFDAEASPFWIEVVLIGFLLSYFLNSLPGLALLCLFPFLVWASFSPWRQPRALLNSAQQPDWVPDFEGGPDRFYALVYERLQSDLTQSQLPFNRLGFGPRSLFSNRHIFSARCLYLEVRYREFSYYIYAVPAPGGLHISSWLFSRHEAWLGHPVLKWLVLWRLSQMTLFQYDIMRLFHSVVDGALAGVINDLRQEKGLRPLEAYERRPVLRGFYAAMQTGAPIGRLGQSAPANGGYVGGAFVDSASIAGAYPADVSRYDGPFPVNRQSVRPQMPEGEAEVPIIEEPLMTQPLVQPASMQQALVQDPILQPSQEGSTITVTEEAMRSAGVMGSAEAIPSVGNGPLTSPRLPLSKPSPNQRGNHQREGLSSGNHNNESEARPQKDGLQEPGPQENESEGHESHQEAH